MYKITAKIVGKNGFQLSDQSLNVYKFLEKGASHVINEKAMRSLRRKYKTLLENYVSIEELDKPKVKEVARVDETPIEAKPLTELGVRELTKEIRQMSKEACEMLMKQENEKDEPRASVIKEIEKRLKKLEK